MKACGYACNMFVHEFELGKTCVQKVYMYKS